MHTTKQIKINKEPHQETPRGSTKKIIFKKMGEETQSGRTSTPSETSNNNTKTGTERSSTVGSQINNTRKKMKSGILNTFKVSVSEVDSVLGTKDDNFKESFQNFQESVLQYVVENYKKWVDIVTIIRKL